MSYDEIVQMANKYIHHEAIRAHTRLPNFPGLRAKLLHLFLMNGNKRVRSNRAQLTLATMLMQIALDMHDLVDASRDGGNGRNDRKTQFRVLAGDYFSSRFYQLLSKAGLIDFVHLLSEAICRLNRLKVNLYIQSNEFLLSSCEYIQQVVQIRNELFRAFSHVLEGTSRTLWPELLHFFSTCEVLAEELEDLDRERVRRRGWVFWYLLEHGSAEDQARLQDAKWSDNGVFLHALATKYQVQNILLDKLGKVYGKLKATIEQVENEEMKRELLALCDPFLRHQKV